MEGVCGHVVDEFLRSDLKYDIKLRERVINEVARCDKTFDIYSFLSTLLYSIVIDPQRHTLFKKTLEDNIAKVRKHISTSPVYASDDCKRFCVYTLCDEDVCTLVNKVPIQVEWDIALRAMCLTILDSQWHQNVQSNDEVPLHIICALKQAHKSIGPIYVRHVIMRACPTPSDDISVPTPSPTPPSELRFQVDLNVMEDFLRRSVLSKSYSMSHPSKLSASAFTGIGSGSSAVAAPPQHTGIDHDLCNVSEDVVKFIARVYAYIQTRYAPIRNKMENIREKDTNQKYIYGILCDNDVVVSHVLAFIFRDGSYAWHKNSYFPILYLEEDGSLKECFKVMQRIADEISKMMKEGTFDEIEVRDEYVGKRFNQCDVDTVMKKLQKYKSKAGQSCWKAVSVETRTVQELLHFLQMQCLFLEIERLCNFMRDKSMSDYVCLEFGTSAVTEYEIESSVRKLIDVEPSLLGVQHTVIRSLENKKHLIINQSVLFSLRNVSYSYVFTNSRRAIKSFPMYPIYMLMLYTETKSPLPKEKDIALRSVMCSVAAWITNHRSATDDILQVNDDLFVLYRFFNHIVSRWNTLDVMARDVSHAYRSYDATTSESNKHTLFSALLGFLHMRKDHCIKKSMVSDLSRLMTVQKNIQEHFPDLYKYYQSLDEYIETHSDIESVNMALNTVMEGLWEEFDNDTRRCMPWVDTYVLCCTKFLTHCQARAVLCSITPVVMPKSRTKVVGRRLQQELYGRMINYLPAFKTPYPPSYAGAKFSSKEVQYGSEHTTDVCMLLRMLEWGSLHDLGERARLENPLGPCNVDPFDLLCVPPMLPVSLCDGNVPLYSDESLFLCVDNTVQTDQQYDGACNRLCELVVHYHNEISRRRDEAEGSRSRRGFSKELNICARRSNEDAEQRAYLKRKVNWNDYFTPYQRDYEVKRLRIAREVHEKGLNALEVRFHLDKFRKLLS